MAHHLKNHTVQELTTRATSLSETLDTAVKTFETAP